MGQQRQASADDTYQPVEILRPPETESELLASKHKLLNHEEIKSKRKKVKEEHSKPKKSSGPITNEQVMQNLSIVAGKRGENRKVKSDDVAMMEEMAHVTESV